MSEPIDYDKLIRVDLIYHEEEHGDAKRWERHYVFANSTIRQLFDAAGVTTKLRGEAWMQDGNSYDAPLYGIHHWGLDAVVRAGSVIHISPHITE